MKKRASSLFNEKITIASPDGEDFELDIQYKPATAYELAQIYDGYEDPSVDEIFDLMAELFQHTIKNVIFVNVPEGTANYDNNEISVQDLTIEQRQKLEMMVAPGVGKSVEPKPKTYRRKNGKGIRKSSK
jgi:hypothetical protein